MKKEIKTWTNKHSQPYAWWLNINGEHEGIVWNPAGIAHIWLHSKQGLCTITFIKDKIKYVRSIKGHVSQIAAARAVNKFIKEILSGEVK